MERSRVRGVISYDNFRLPKRRDVSYLTEQISCLSDGDMIEAVFSNERYGVYSFEGSLRKSSTIGSLMLAGQWIESKGIPDRTIFKVLSLDHLSEVPSSVDTTMLSHGDAVSAWIEDQYYGTFRVSGVALWSEVGQYFSVGGWFISNGRQPSRKLRALAIQDRVGAHDLPVPEFLREINEIAISD
jgi:hypothetical protein